MEEEENLTESGIEAFRDDFLVLRFCTRSVISALMRSPSLRRKQNREEREGLAKKRKEMQNQQ
jgi:hypothetical protein